MRIFAFILLFLFATGCANTWEGVKKDSSNAANWSKEKINQGASWVEEKTAD